MQESEKFNQPSASRKRDGRRSSGILKIKRPCLVEMAAEQVQEREDELGDGKRLSRRVSFAERCSVKEFPKDSPQTWSLSPEVNTDKDEPDDTFTEDMSVHISGLDMLLKGEIQSQKNAEKSMLNCTHHDVVDMDMTSCYGGDVSKVAETKPPPSASSFLSLLTTSKSGLNISSQEIQGAELMFQTDDMTMELTACLGSDKSPNEMTENMQLTNIITKEPSRRQSLNDITRRFSSGPSANMELTCNDFELDLTTDKPDKENMFIKPQAPSNVTKIASPVKSQAPLENKENQHWDDLEISFKDTSQLSTVDIVTEKKASGTEKDPLSFRAKSHLSCVLNTEVAEISGIDILDITQTDVVDKVQSSENIKDPCNEESKAHVPTLSQSTTPDFSDTTSPQIDFNLDFGETLLSDIDGIQSSDDFKKDHLKALQISENMKKDVKLESESEGKTDPKSAVGETLLSDTDRIPSAEDFKKDLSKVLKIPENMKNDVKIESQSDRKTDPECAVDSPPIQNQSLIVGQNLTKTMMDYSGLQKEVNTPAIGAHLSGMDFLDDSMSLCAMMGQKDPMLDKSGQEKTPSSLVPFDLAKSENQDLKRRRDSFESTEAEAANQIQCKDIVQELSDKSSVNPEMSLLKDTLSSSRLDFGDLSLLVPSSQTTAITDQCPQSFVEQEALGKYAGCGNMTIGDEPMPDCMMEVDIPTATLATNTSLHDAKSSQDAISSQNTTSAQNTTSSQDNALYKSNLSQNTSLNKTATSSQNATLNKSASSQNTPSSQGTALNRTTTSSQDTTLNKTITSSQDNTLNKTNTSSQNSTLNKTNTSSQDSALNKTVTASQDNTFNKTITSSQDNTLNKTNTQQNTSSLNRSDSSNFITSKLKTDGPWTFEMFCDKMSIINIQDKGRERNSIVMKQEIDLQNFQEVLEARFIMVPECQLLEATLAAIHNQQQQEDDLIKQLKIKIAENEPKLFKIARESPKCADIHKQVVGFTQACKRLAKQQWKQLMIQKTKKYHETIQEESVELEHAVQDILDHASIITEQSLQVEKADKDLDSAISRLQCELEKEEEEEQKQKQKITKLETDLEEKKKELQVTEETKLKREIELREIEEKKEKLENKKHEKQDTSVDFKSEEMKYKLLKQKLEYYNLIHEWHVDLDSFTKDSGRFLFLKKSIELHVTYRLTDKKEYQIRMVKLLSHLPESSEVWFKLGHNLAMERLNSLQLNSKYLGQNKINQLLDEVSNVIYEVETVIRDLDQIDNRHPVTLTENIIKFNVLNADRIRKVTISLKFNANNITAPSIDVKCIIGDINVDKLIEEFDSCSRKKLLQQIIPTTKQILAH